MKRAMIIACCFVLGSSIAFAQQDVGSIDVFSDAGLADCNFVDNGGLIAVYVAATHASDGTSGAQWKMVIPSTWTFFGQVSPFPTVVGNALEGISIGYGQCLSGDGAVLILTVNMLGNNQSPTCSHISIVPDPASPSGQIEIVDCQSPFPEKWLFDAAGQGVVNSDGSCNCNVPVQDTTWGGIKALYK